MGFVALLDSDESLKPEDGSFPNSHQQNQLD